MVRDEFSAAAGSFGGATSGGLAAAAGGRALQSASVSLVSGVGAASVVMRGTIPRAEGGLASVPTGKLGRTPSGRAVETSGRGVEAGLASDWAEVRIALVGARETRRASADWTGRGCEGRDGRGEESGETASGGERGVSSLPGRDEVLPIGVLGCACSVFLVSFVPKRAELGCRAEAGVDGAIVDGAEGGGADGVRGEVSAVDGAEGGGADGVRGEVSAVDGVDGAEGGGANGVRGEVSAIDGAEGGGADGVRGEVSAVDGVDGAARDDSGSVVPSTWISALQARHLSVAKRPRTLRSQISSGIANTALQAEHVTEWGILWARAYRRFGVPEMPFSCPRFARNT